MINFDTKTYFIIIIIISLGYINFMSNNEKFFLSDDDLELKKEIQSITKETDLKTLINNCDTESLESCDICKNAYDNYNLYPSSNPFVVRGNDINMNYKNKIDNPVILSELGTKNYQVLNNIIKDYNPNDNEMTQKAFDELLKSSPLKTGCCFRNRNDDSQRNVLVRIPLNPNENVDSQLKNFDFKFKSLTIPKNSCPVDYYAASNDCNSFFDVYCTNLVNEFNKLNLPLDNFTKYAPECACYAPKTQVQQLYPENTPSSCYKTNCDNIINPIAYIDPISRNNQCNLTVCNNIFNANNITPGGNVTIDAKIENACGNNLPIDNTKQKLDDTKPKPDDTKPKPDDTKQKPDDTKQKPDDTKQKPDDTKPKPDDTKPKPDDTKQQPDDTKLKPDDTNNTTNSIILYVIIFVVFLLIIGAIILMIRK